MTTYQNITGVVKLLKPEGYGFIMPDTSVGAHDKDVFFHAECIESADWSKVRVGQKVLIVSVTPNRRGLQANKVVLL